MVKKDKKKSLDEIKNQIPSILSTAKTNRDLQIDFNKMSDYFDGKLPAVKQKNGTHYYRPIAANVTLSVEAYMVNQFLSNDKLSNSEEFNQLTTYKDIYNCISDGVKYGCGALMYNENIKSEEIKLDGIDFATLQMYEADPNVVDLKYEEVIDEMGNQFVNAKAIFETSNPTITHIDISDVFVDDVSNKMNDNNFIAIREYVTKEEAMEYGIDEADIDKLTAKTKSEEYNTTLSDESIHETEIDQYELFKYQYNVGNTTYTGMMTDSEVLTCEYIPIKPFDLYVWSPMPKNETIYGFGMVEVSINTQDLCTNLWRNIQNNAGLSSFPQRILDKTRFTVAEASKLTNPMAGQIVSLQGPPQGAIEDIMVPFVGTELYTMAKENELNHYETYGVASMVTQSPMQNKSATAAEIQESNATQKLRNYCKQFSIMLSEIMGNDDNINFGRSQDISDEERATDLTGMLQLLMATPNVDPASIQNIIMELGQIAKIPVNFVEPQQPGPDPLVELNREKIEMDGNIEATKIRMDKYRFDQEMALKREQLQANIVDDDIKNQLKQNELQLKY